VDGQTTFWFFVLSGLQKLEQRAKKCTEFRGECVEKIPSLVAVACFLPGRAQGLSAPPRTKGRNIYYQGRRNFSCPKSYWLVTTEI
jgi:hypothetical protein